MNPRLIIAGILPFALYAVATAQTQIQAPKAAIAGNVVRAGTGEPLRKALVTLRPAAQPGQANLLAVAEPGLQGAQRGGAGQRGQPSGGAKSIVTGDDGSFTFPDLDAGQYRISVERAGYIPQEYGQRSWTSTGTNITLASTQKLTGLSVSLTPAGTIAGRILDERGEALASVQVQALSYTYQQGVRTLTSTSQAQTNDLGEYRLYWLVPNEYYLSAMPGPDQQRLTQDGRGGRGGPPPGNLLNAPAESYAPTYFPGGIEPERATPVTLAAAAEVRGIDFVLKTIPAVKVKGRVTSPEAIPAVQNQAGRGQPGGPRGGGERGQQQPFPGGAGMQVVLSRIGPAVGGRGGGPGGRGQGGPGGGLDQPSARVNADGSFEISNVIPGSYNLTGIQQSQDRILSARTRVEVGNSGVDFVRLDLRYGISITGQIQPDGAPSSQFRMNQMRVSLTPAENLPFGNADVQVDETGKFVLTNIAAMGYRISVAGLTNGSYLVSGRYGSSEALNDFLQVSDEGTRLSLLIGFAPGQVSGNATDVAGKPFQAATCVLIPAVRSRTDLYKTATTDQSGQFSFSNVAPGDYKVLAWEDIPRGAYLDAAYLTKYEDRAQTITIGKMETKSLQVRVIAAGTP